MKHILTFIVGITFILNVHAQESRWGITSSLGVSEVAIPIADNQAYELKPSYGLGLVSEIQLINHLSARLGVRYTRKGGQKNIQVWDGFRDVTVSKRAFRLSLIEIPVAVSLDFGKKNGFILTGGIYYGLAFSGKAVRQDRGEPETSESIAFTDTFHPAEGRFQMKGADFGYIAMIGYKLDDVIIDLGLNASIATVRPDNHPVDEYEWKHVVVKVNVSYFFNE
ncbi:MAG: PorT family protein [Cytophagales bacterium]|nr:PorT family protein [Cytophagales bacterium]